MNPLIYMLLKPEMELKAEQEKYLPKYDDTKIDKPLPQPKKKALKRFIARFQTQKNCEYS